MDTFFWIHQYLNISSVNRKLDERYLATKWERRTMDDGMKVVLEAESVQGKENTTKQRIGESHTMLQDNHVAPRARRSLYRFRHADAWDFLSVVGCLDHPQDSDTSDLVAKSRASIKSWNHERWSDAGGNLMIKWWSRFAESAYIDRGYANGQKEKESEI